MTNPDGLKQDLATTRERLMAAIAGVSEQQFKKRPAATPEDPEPWCIAELLAHILDFEQLWMARIAQALDRPESAVEPSDDATHQATARAGRLAPVPQLVHGLVAARRGLDQLVDRAGAGDGLNRAVLHPTRGRLTVAWMVQTYGIGHQQEHIGQIERLKELVGTSAV